MSRPVYDPENIFAKILRGEIPCNKADECPHTLSFHDIQPQRQTHILVIPKGAYVDMTDFSENASPEEHTAFFCGYCPGCAQGGSERRGVSCHLKYREKRTSGCPASAYAYSGW